LEEWFHPSVQEGRFEGVSGSVFTNGANEACGASRSHGGHRNVGGAPATSTRDLGGGIGAASPGCVEPNGDLVNEVADADD
jgi:hypothetical protein